jgi:phosphohistidine phosphatase
MELILWRHADARPGEPDAARPLTPKGRKQADAMARWLKIHLPKDARILASPAARAKETADALKRDCEIVEGLAPDKSAQDMLAAAGWPEAGGTVVLVGHNPAIGRLAALLLNGSEADSTIRKGAAWWFTSRVREGESQVVLKAVMSPGMARKAAARRKLS